MTSDKDGPDSVFEKELVDADIIISQPFWPAYMTAGQGVVLCRMFSFWEWVGRSWLLEKRAHGGMSHFEKRLPCLKPSLPFRHTERFAKAKKLKLIITAGIGSDHTDLAEAVKRKVDVVEVRPRILGEGVGRVHRRREIEEEPQDLSC